MSAVEKSEVLSLVVGSGLPHRGVLALRLTAYI